MRSTFLFFLDLFLSGLTSRAHADAGEAGAIAGRLLEVGPSHEDIEDRGDDRAVLPAATSPRSYQPLTGTERWNLYLREAFWSRGVFFHAARPALGAQLNNEPPAWGEGAKGYSRRFANRFGRFACRKRTGQPAPRRLDTKCGMSAARAPVSFRAPVTQSQRTS